MCKGISQFLCFKWLVCRTNSKYRLHILLEESLIILKSLTFYAILFTLLCVKVTFARFEVHSLLCHRQKMFLRYLQVTNSLSLVKEMLFQEQVQHNKTFVWPKLMFLWSTSFPILSFDFLTILLSSLTTTPDKIWFHLECGKIYERLLLRF